MEILSLKTIQIKEKINWESEIIKTVLNDDIIFPVKKPIYDQLLFDPKHKEYEANLLLKLPNNFSFLDIGGHYGDTVLTMAIHARKNNRDDIRFFVFEPNLDKCIYIKKISLLNNLNINVLNVGVGNLNTKIKSDGKSKDLKGKCKYIYHYQKRIYEKKNDRGNTIAESIKLDSIRSVLEPIGFMHIDVEGWETRVLEGSNEILKNKNNKMHIIAEYLSVQEKNKILNLMNNYEFNRDEDLIDGPSNLVFFNN